MAELDVVRKKNSMLPWLLLALLLIALVVFLVWNNSRDNNVATPAVTDSTAVVDTTGRVMP
jgi:hypothetical protein